MNADRMLTVEEAQEIVLDSVSVSGIERVPLSESQGRVLAEDVAPKYDVPPHDNSSVDGYAVRAADTAGASADAPCRLGVLEDIPAGTVPSRKVGPGKASRIMTGAFLPEGADAVVMVENTRQLKEAVEVLKAVEPGQNVRYRGEDVRQGRRVLFGGAEIGPGEIGLLAAFQRSQVAVRRRPAVAILSTGDEVVEIDERLVPGKIVNSNSYSLAALVRECNCRPVNLGLARDSESEIAKAIRSALSADVVLSTGGVSVGDYDYVKKVLEDLGADMRFWRVKMKPGKPLAYGLLQGKPFFGLPGNPVSCMVSFLLFARPAMRKMMGYGPQDWHLPAVPALLENDLTAGGDRRHYLRARITRTGGRFHVSTVAGQGSGMLSSMTGTNGLVIVETGVTSVACGTEVSVLLMGAVGQAVP
ncbi:MAG: molybdopterin molybdotransferase MoeA [Gemmatimonadetes bacterium]|nr:molybdopterin molybdotransferase MoeA [Gemmatimonadota bacterium]